MSQYSSQTLVRDISILFFLLCSSEEEVDEDDHFDEDEEDEEIVLNDASDHEFSPESDLEDEDFQPVKRARTAHSSTHF